ncbi:MULTISPECIES: cobaltochelatase subunit CobN [Rhizobium]|uniref:Cobaltochelatase subunit CobN n=1 Tax=Rhizobium rhododendri TaxID=2506430 RepID=A0ABY8IM70_9HYPH|nr:MULTISPECIES: cobaltochelatase subunit CobN [Rhizobium]MBZ5758392.1 cobaltochelatase subunit CobN [Rhizobium sp. VS19-DR96]MBZ5764778.1 cobaltochelatase subunit CobN [Rhizobium sp. VS19-DR129.2]MBZ5772321.1 cobaltochelatase subunit CobN [Rhizobium sp. VS19-DRK62.2]MBZ5782992.1 cobaltochelatase subunit CobN [Rhizobium sp. VS19-DR121]MBZ5800440.1 cobaltochelatase subunit CobN [Rhizobium sp. VS19-DR181]
MHLLLAQKGSISDGDEAIDLGQSPGDILFLSAADTELAAIAAAYAHNDGTRSLRLASLLSMKHPMSVDTYVERTARHAKMIIVRALGGASYFQYALEALHAVATRQGAKIAVIPGDSKPDPGVMPFSNIALDDLNALWSYLIEGGDDNARAFLAYASAMLSGAEKPQPASPLAKAGIWWPGQGVVDVDAWEVASEVATLPPSVGRADISPTREENNREQRPIVAISFYRALVQSGETRPVEAMISALVEAGVRPLPVFAYSLKDPASKSIIADIFGAALPDVVINTTGFAISAPGADRKPTVLEASDAVVLQAIFSASSKEAWTASAQGLSARDLGMNVALPEVDGRVLSRAVSFKAAARYDERVEANIVGSEPSINRMRYTASLAANWARLRRTPPGERRVALVMANYPNRDGRLGNGVGLDTPAGTVEVMRAMAANGYPVADIPADGDALITHLMQGPTNSGRDGKVIRETLSMSRYKTFFASLPVQIQDEVTARWGGPEGDTYVVDGAFALSFARFGEMLVGIQPARGYNIDPKESYHSPDLVPPHGYLAFYAFLRQEFGAHAVIHMGKHGNLEWLPGKALALSETCYPEAILGPMPHLYPFIVNDPGEGTQAKRRTSAVIIDHLTPPLTRAESYGPLKDLEALVDEYYEASGVDPRRILLLRKQILDLVTDIGLDQDAGIAKGESEESALQKLDAYLCDLKEMQIRDGLHVFGVSPQGRLLTDLTVALARVPRGLGEGGDQSLQRAIAADAGLAAFVCDAPPPSVGSADISPTRGEIGMPRRGHKNAPAELAAKADFSVEIAAAPSISPLVGEMSDRTEGGKPPQPKTFDPLDCGMADAWAGQRPKILVDVSGDPWRTNGDTVERIELLATRLVDGTSLCPPDWSQTQAVLAEIESRLKPSIQACGPAEIDGLLAGLDGRFVPPGPSGAPTRGRPDVLPTGRNFYSVDSRAVPTPAAYQLGKASAELLVRRYVQDHGEWPVSIGLTAWGTSNMRTGGDDIAQAMALIGVKPLWDMASRRVTGYEIIPPAMLGRPRVDVTLRISGFFRDAFPEQIALFDKAVRAVGALDEDPEDNAIAARMQGETARLMAEGLDAAAAAKRAGYRVFGSKPGAYGAGLQALIDEKGWEKRADLAEAYLVWGSYAYGAGEDGKAERGVFEERLASIQAVVQNQDNREHDLLDSDDYYQFEGGMAAAAEQLGGARPPIYHNDHSRPEKPVIRSLEEEIGRVVRGRVVNPKWISGVMRHGYKGAAEIAATVDFLFAFSATTGAVRDHHFEAVYQAFVTDARVADFMTEKNPAAFADMKERLLEAIDRQLWTPRSNSARFALMETGEEALA